MFTTLLITSQPLTTTTTIIIHLFRKLSLSHIIILYSMLLGRDFNLHTHYTYLLATTV